LKSSIVINSSFIDPDIFELSNGIRVVHQYMPREVAHCGIMIGSGSRDERKDEHGLAHFLEHCFFKGTQKRKTYHILSRLDAVGGELNAFTSKEETWVHASFLYSDYERAIELIADISFNSTFPSKELEREKEVIVDEINSYKDSPSDMIFEEFDEFMFSKHPLGRSILGTEQSLKRFTREHLLDFKSRNFYKGNVLFASAGNITTEKLQRLLEKYLAHWQLAKKAKKKAFVQQYKPFHHEVVKDIHQVHYLMGVPAYSFHDEKRPAFSLLNNILGGPAMNNRLSMKIREKHGIAYQIDSSYVPFTDAGVFSIYLGTEKENLQKTKSLIWKELNLLKDKPLSDTQLHEAKRQLIGQIALAQDSGSAVMFNLAKSLMLFDKIDSLAELFEKINEITAAEIHETANEIFDENKMSSLAYLY
jgi:predicted Zn-dependent peptidase